MKVKQLPESGLEAVLVYSKMVPQKSLRTLLSVL